MSERSEHRRARERTDTEQAALDGKCTCPSDMPENQFAQDCRRCTAVYEWMQLQVTRHQQHGCQPDATGCVEAGPAMVDDRSELGRRGWPRGGLGASPAQRAILDRLRPERPEQDSE